MHEMDHCATTEYVDISEQEYEKDNGKLAIVGIGDYRQVIKNGINLKKLNEGITAYKQEMYDEFLGNKPSTNYKIEKNVAKFIGDVIGKEELIRMHFNNDYEGIRIAFKENSGKDLNELVKRLNKKSKIKTMLFGKMYTRNFSKKLEKFMGEYNINEKGYQRNTEFIPKWSVDYTKIGNSMDKNSKLQEYTKDSKIQGDR